MTLIVAPGVTVAYGATTPFEELAPARATAAAEAMT